MTSEQRTERPGGPGGHRPGWRVPEGHTSDLLAGIFHSGPSGVAVLDRAGVVLAANRALAVVCRRDVEDLVGRRWETLVHPDDRASDAELCRRAEATIDPVPPVEVRLTCPDGSSAWVLLGVAFVHDEDGRFRFTEPTGRPSYSLRLVTDISHEKRVEADLVARAGRDPLTGLPNRTLLLEHLTHSLHTLEREGGSIAVLFFDLDRFKVVNDSLGHNAGDEMLRVVADRVAAAFRPEDLVARLGGDEFVVTVAAHARQPARDVIAAATRIHETLRAPIPVDGRDLFTSASIGIATTADPAAAPEALLRDADTAMYLAKQRGGNRYELFDTTLRTAVVDRLELEQDLRDAIRAGALSVAYQPIVRLADGAVVAAEALVRWAHPTRGLLLPDVFIPLAEETGLVQPLDRLVIERACRQAAAWHARLGADAPAVRVNLSGRELGDTDLPEHITTCLTDHALPPSLLCVEITETALVADPAAAGRALSRLRAHGVRVAIDDFGTGYASLAYLTKFPIDMVKIDRSFVRAVDTDRQNAAVVTAIVSLARTLNLTVTAEGVETTAQRDFLRRVGCRNGQGYLWAPPSGPEQMDRMLGAHGG